MQKSFIIVAAMDAEGTFYYVSLTQEGSSIDTGYASAANGSAGERSWHKYTADGKHLFSDNGGWGE